MKQTCGSGPEEGCDKGRGQGVLPWKDPEVNGDMEWKKKTTWWWWSERLDQNGYMPGVIFQAA